MIDFLPGFTIGFLGSLHCVGMCGPLIIALPIGSAGTGRFLAGRLLYHGGRVMTYMLLGAVAGLLGGAMAFVGAQQSISIIVGVLMLAGVLLPSLLRRLSSRWQVLRAFTLFLRTHLGTLLRRHSLPALAGIGMLNGFLPCGLVYVALGTALTLGEPARATVFLAGFGTGTIPALLGVGVAGKFLFAGGRRTIAVALPLFTALLAILLILRGLNLGIPFVSPKASATHAASTEAPHCGAR